MRRLMTAMLAALAVIGCATTGSPDRVALAGTEWRVTQIGGAAAIPSSRASIAFGPDGRFSGNASCNRMFGTYRAGRPALSLSAVGLTRMLCAPAQMAQERALVGLLEHVETYRIDPDGTLVLTTRSGARIVARR
jgi:heat shock protein HslJ